jgi:hypothetical protein
VVRGCGPRESHLEDRCQHRSASVYACLCLHRRCRTTVSQWSSSRLLIHISAAAPPDRNTRTRLAHSPGSSPRSPPGRLPVDVEIPGEPVAQTARCGVVLRKGERPMHPPRKGSPSLGHPGVVPCLQVSFLDSESQILEWLYRSIYRIRN